MFEILSSNKPPTFWTLLKFCMGIAVIIVIVLLPFALLNGAFSRNVKPLADTYSIANVKALSARANEMHSGLEGELATLMALKESVGDYNRLYGDDTSRWPQGKRSEWQQVVNQYRQSLSAYNTNCGNYNALWDDEWKGVVAPSDLPTRCELLTSVPSQ